MGVVCQGRQVRYGSVQYNQEPDGDNQYPEGTVGIISCIAGARQNGSIILCTSSGWTPELTDCEIGKELKFSYTLFF